MEKLKMETPDITADNIEKIAALFPSSVTEMRGEDGKVKKGINFEILKQLLSPDVVDGDERYEFTWVGKKAAIAEAARPITKTLRPVKEDSRDWDTTQNLYIEGDNLEALKILQESYLGKVKMIYIDPPYNTGSDFIYADDFMRSQNEENEQMGMYDEEDNRLFKNTDTNGKFHSDWCSMMYSRLIIARSFLTPDGVIFISIDDNEVFNLKEICDDVFGAHNFIVQFAVQLNPRGRNLDRFVAKTHESVLVYAMDCLQPTTIYGIEKEGRMVDEYNKEDGRGKYRAIGLRNRNQAFNPQTRPNLYYPLYVNPKTCKVSVYKSEEYCDEVWPKAPDGIQTCWTWMKTKVESEYDFVIAERCGDEWRIYRKDYLFDLTGKMATTLVKSVWVENTINNDYGKKSIKDLFGTNIMSFPKSPDFIRKIVEIGSSTCDLIMDFFSGSATTAHAVMHHNAEDGGHRKFIMVQLPELCDEKSEAYKAGYKNICEIGKERIRRAGDKLKEENPLGTQNLDIGFRVFRVDESNMKDVYYHPEEMTQMKLGETVSNIKEDRTDLDLLYSCLLDWGVEIHLPHTSSQVAGCTVHDVDGGALVACFDSKIPTEVVEYMAKLQPLRAVFRDSAFATDADKINVTEIFKNLSPDTSVRVI